MALRGKEGGGDPLKLARPASNVPSTLRDPLPHLLTIAGESMAPTLPKGTRVRVEPMAGAPVPGQIVVIQGRDAFIVHRVVGVDLRGTEPIVVHRGDAFGRLGVCFAGDVVGRFVGAVSRDASVGLPETLPLAARRAFSSAQRRCRTYLALRRVARAMKVDRALPSALRSRFAESLFLR